MKNVFDVLKERGFIKQTIYEDELVKKLGEESVPFYIGFDPTADSLHIGHYIPIMAMSWLQKYGHKPIALFGGGTGDRAKDVSEGPSLMMVAFDISAFNDPEKYYADVDARIAELKGSKLAKNSKGIFMPGELEDRKYKATLESGTVEVLPENLKMVNDVAAEMGLEGIKEI